MDPTLLNFRLMLTLVTGLMDVYLRGTQDPRSIVPPNQGLSSLDSPYQASPSQCSLGLTSTFRKDRLGTFSVLQ